MSILHHLEGGALGAQNGAAQGQQAAEIVRLHLLVVAVDQAVIAVQDADDLDVFAHADVERFRHAADGRVQTGAVAAGGQDANTFLLKVFCKNCRAAQIPKKQLTTLRRWGIISLVSGTAEPSAA